MLLARTLGRTLEELGETMSAAEYRLWEDDYARAPWGELRADFAAGLIASTLANVHRKPDAPPYKPLDFMPYAQPEREAPEASEAEQIRAFAQLMNTRAPV